MDFPQPECGCHVDWRILYRDSGPDDVLVTVAGVDQLPTVYQSAKKAADDDFWKHAASVGSPHG